MGLRVLTLNSNTLHYTVSAEYKSSNGKYLGCNSHIAEALFIPEVFEGGDHVRLEVVPAQAELLIVSHGGLRLSESDRYVCNKDQHLLSGHGTARTSRVSCL